MKKLLLLLSFIFFIFSHSFAQQRGIGITVDKKPMWFGDSVGSFSKIEQPVSQFPPFCGKKLRSKGNSVQFPFGTGLQAMFMEQKFVASNLQLTSEIMPIVARADTVYQNTVSSLSQLTIRPDVWITSFLNVYGIFGYTNGKTNPNLTVPYIVLDVPGFEPIIIDTTFQIHDELIYRGPTYGGGATISAGFKSFFFVLDYNYTVTKPVDIYDKIINQSFSPKIGVFLGRPKSKLSGMFWVGSMFLSNEHNFSGTITVSEIASELVPFFGETANYTGTVTPVNQWNMLVGASVALGNHHFLSAEGGFIGRKQLMLMYDFRF
jgi:hypothetical protein